MDGGRRNNKIQVRNFRFVPPNIWEGYFDPCEKKIKDGAGIVITD